MTAEFGPMWMLALVAASWIIVVGVVYLLALWIGIL